MFNLFKPKRFVVVPTGSYPIAFTVLDRYAGKEVPTSKHWYEENARDEARELNRIARTPVTFDWEQPGYKAPTQSPYSTYY